MKPSEMIEGLDRVAERAEKAEARETAKRKAGGKVADSALLGDDTGRRWSRNVNLAILGTIILVSGVAAALFWFSNREVVDPRRLRAESQETLAKLVAMASRIKPFEEGDTITPEKVKDALLKVIDADLSTINDEIAKDKARRAKDSKFRTPDRMMSTDLNSLNRLHAMKDAWGQPLVFAMADADTVKITATCKPVPGMEALEPKTVRLRSGKAPAAEKESK